MRRVQEIFEHPLYREEFAALQEAEKNRIFCRHDLTHFLDVARIAMICSLKETFGISEEIIYAAALLHDIGRFREIRDGIPHNEAGASLAEKIMKDCGFSEEEIKQVSDAIGSHREKSQLSGGLEYLIKYADKASRNCFVCDAYDRCKWSEDKKNRTITV